MTPDERSARARVAANKRHHPNDPKTHELAAEFKAERLTQRIQRLVDEATALTDRQRELLGALLRGAGVSS